VAHLRPPTLRADQELSALLVACWTRPCSPYLFFWQSAHRLDRDAARQPEGGSKEHYRLKRQSPAPAQRKQRTSRLDVFAGMTVLQPRHLFAIIVATAQTLACHNKTNHPNLATTVNAKATQEVRLHCPVRDARAAGAVQAGVTAMVADHRVRATASAVSANRASPCPAVEPHFAGDRTDRHRHRLAV